MAYNYYNPYYQTPYAPQQNMPVQTQPQPQNQQSSGLLWCQGEAGAKSYLVAPNTTVMLMDSETQRFYLKSSDASGMPLPLRIFEYSEIMAQNAPTTPPVAQSIDTSSFATKAELEAFRAEIDGILKNASRQPKKKEVNEDV